MKLKVAIVGPHGPMAFHVTPEGFQVVPTNPEQDTVAAFKDEIKYLPSRCNGNVRTAYIMGEATRMATTIGFVYDDVKTLTRRARTVEVRGHPTGFVLAFDDKDGLYIDVICNAANAPGGGAALLKCMIEYVKHKRLGAITLSSLPTVLTYYPKFGFRFRSSCSGPEVQVPPALEAEVAQLVAAKKVPKTIEEAYDDPVFFKLLKFLQEKDLNVNKDGCSKFNARNLARNDCGKDGYTMKLCTGSPSRKPRSPKAKSPKPKSPKARRSTRLRKRS